jgi:hypothetical protein
MRMDGTMNLRRSIGVEEDVSVFEFLRVGARLEVLLKGVLADVAFSDRRDGRLVDYLVSYVLFCHGCFGKYVGIGR